MQFCHGKQIDKINPSLGEILIFLTWLQDEGLSYSAINTAKSMLSALFDIIHKRDIGKEVLIQRHMKGIFQLKPVIPKPAFTWDVIVVPVLRCLDTMNSESLTLWPLSIKLAILLVLTIGQRCQTLKAMSLRNMEVNRNYVKIRIGERHLDIRWKK